MKEAQKEKKSKGNKDVKRQTALIRTPELCQRCKYRVEDEEGHYCYWLEVLKIKKVFMIF